MADNTLAVFEKYKIRRLYDDKAETWYFSVIDVVAALTDSVKPRDYWFKMKIRVKTEDELELSTIEDEFVALTNIINRHGAVFQSKNIKISKGSKRKICVTT